MGYELMQADLSYKDHIFQKGKEKTSLVPRMRFYLWKLKFSVVRIHALYLLSCWRSQNLKSKK